MQECGTCIAVKEELQTAKNHNDELLEAMQEKNRSVIHFLQNLINRPGGGDLSRMHLGELCRKFVQHTSKMKRIERC